MLSRVELGGCRSFLPVRLAPSSLPRLAGARLVNSAVGLLAKITHDVATVADKFSRSRGGYLNAETALLAGR